MIVFLNGHLVPENEAKVSVFDRSFLYGDGLFETVRVYGGKPFRWRQHLERLELGADFLEIQLPYGEPELTRFASELIARNHLPDALLRLTLSRGVGRRGYSPHGAEDPVVVMAMHPAPAIDPAHPASWRLATASLRVAKGDPLANLKTCNKLVQVLARAEAEEHGADEALVRNTADEVAEAASSNLFWIEHGSVLTPPLTVGVLAGVTRGVIIELCREMGITFGEKEVRVPELINSDGVFLTSSAREVVEAVSIDGFGLKQSPLVAALREAYRGLVRRETQH